MTRTLGRLDPKTPIACIGDYLLESDGISSFNVPIAGGKIITHMWTSSTTGGTVKYVGVDGNTYTIYLARDMGRVPVLFIKFIDNSSLTTAELWWGRTGNYMYDEQV